MVNYVFYDDTDCGGIVYHTNYIIFCERARSLFFFKNGVLPQQNTQGFVVKDMESQFFTPLKLGDTYRVLTTLLEFKHTFIVLRQEVIKIGEVYNDEVLHIKAFDMRIKLAYIDVVNKKPCKIPDNLRQILSSIHTLCD